MLGNRRASAEWTTDTVRSTRTADRTHFRLWATGYRPKHSFPINAEHQQPRGRTRRRQPVLAVALFCDQPTQGSGLAVAPTVRLVRAAIARACGDAGIECTSTKQATSINMDQDRDLAVLLLRSDTGANCRTVRGDVRQLLASVSHATGGRVTVELWHVRELQYNVLRLQDVPRHWLASPDEVPGSGALVEALPLMLVHDPVARAMALRVGDIVAIQRRDSRTGISMYYRRVVAAPEHTPIPMAKAADDLQPCDTDNDE